VWLFVVLVMSFRCFPFLCFLDASGGQTNASPRPTQSQKNKNAVPPFPAPQADTVDY